MCKPVWKALDGKAVSYWQAMMHTIETMETITLTVRQSKTGPVLGYHPWVFSGAILQIPEGLVPGQPVRLVGEKGRFLAFGYFNSYSQISVRVWGHDETEEIDGGFFERRVAQAYRIRQQFVEKEGTDSYRLINGENDYLPGLIVDKYADFLVAQFHTRGIEVWREQVFAALERVMNPKGIYERSDMSVRKLDNLGMRTGLVHGTIPDVVTIRENGFTFLVDLKAGQKTGFFLDQRDKRQALMKYADNRSILNCFSYTGAFSVYALAGGATRVTNVDSSEAALKLAEENVKLNGMDPDKCRFIVADAKDYLRNSAEKWDVIVLDPPAFIKDRRKKHEGIVGYRNLNELALRILGQDAILVTCSCSTHLSPEEFRFLLVEAGARARRPLQILETFTHGMDHPVLAPFREGEYLKCLIIRV
jgi:23S rRNA (cytosine1962-C5)-methyltransferase